MEEIEKKEIKIDWKGREEVVVLKKLTFGERNDLQEEVTEIKYVGSVPQIFVKTGKMRELSILKSLMKAPFKIDISEIRNLPNEVGEKIYEEIDKLNKLSEIKKQD